MSYIKYVSLLHNILAVIFSSLSIYYCINVLFRKSVLKKSVKLSPTITVYFGFVFICSLSSVLYFGYLTIFWRPDFQDHNAYILFFGGLFPAVFFHTSPIAETFLCVERCISLLFPIKYTQKFKNYFAILTFFGILAAIGAASYVNRYFDLIPTTSKTLCESFSCLAGAFSSKNLLIIRIGFNIINIASALFLAFLIKRTIANCKTAAKMNKTVFILLISTTVIELVPFIIAQIYVMITGEQLYQYIGSFSTTAIFFNTFLSVKLYFKAFKKFKCNSNNVRNITDVVPQL